MLAIFFRFVEIALCRKGPQDLPASGFLLGLTLAINGMVLALSIFMFQRTDMLRGALQSLFGLASEFLLVWILLVVFKHRERMLQTITAVLGVDTVINFAFIPLLVSMPSAPGEAEASALQGFLLLGLLVWGVMALGCILRHAVNVPLVSGAAMALAYHIAVYALITAAI